MLLHNFKGAKSVLGQDLQVQSGQKCRPSNSAAAALFWGSALRTDPQLYLSSATEEAQTKG